jgi:hypothetical protein
VGFGVTIASRARHVWGGGWAYRLQTFVYMFAGVKVFTATKAKERESLGEMVTMWLRENPRARIVDKIVTQSSDDQFHCLTITLFYATEE